jgi:hypothetical protein
VYEPGARSGFVVTLLVLAACHSRNESMKPQDAARWLQQACGITFARDPVVLSSTSATSATVELPAAEVTAALEALRNNRTLHKRGQSDTRYGYESFPESSAAKQCELDTALHVLYFSYTE